MTLDEWIAQLPAEHHDFIRLDIVKCEDEDGALRPANVEVLQIRETGVEYARFLSWASVQ